MQACFDFLVVSFQASVIDVPGSPYLPRPHPVAPAKDRARRSSGLL